MRLWTPDELHPVYWYTAAVSSTWVEGSSVNDIWYNYALFTRSYNNEAYQMSLEDLYWSRGLFGSYHYLYDSGYGKGTIDLNGPVASFNKQIYGMSWYAVASISTWEEDNYPVIVSVGSGSDYFQRLTLNGINSTTLDFRATGQRLVSDSLQYVEVTRSGISIGSPSIYSGIFDYENAQLYAGVDGVYTARSGGFQVAGNTDTTTVGVRVGNTSDQTDSIQLLGDLIGICEALSTENRQRMDGYLAHKYGLTGRLASDHPYKTVPPYIMDDGTSISAYGVISGNAVVLDDGAAEKVGVFNSTTGEFLAEATPDEAGDWTASVPVGDVYLTYFSTGCQPITHGPYTVSA